MTTQRKISSRRIIQAALTLVLLVVCVVAILSATRVQGNREVKGINIKIENEQFGFVTKADVKALLMNGNRKLSKIDVRKAEALVRENAWVGRAEIYIDNAQMLHASVVQKVPVVRIFEQTGDTSYYLDRNMNAFPVSDKYTYYAPVVTNVPVYKNDSTGNKLRNDILTLVQYINRDTFWNAQVSQIIVRDDRKFEIVPVLGGQQIIIGSVKDLDKKFNNLFAFYKQVLNEVGWDKYEVLDLSYKGQLVASPALKWNLPKDDVMNRINWVNSISGAADEHKVRVINNALTTTKPAVVMPPPPPVPVKVEAVKKEVKEEKVVITPKPEVKPVVKPQAIVAQPKAEAKPQVMFKPQKKAEAKPVTKPVVVAAKPEKKIVKPAVIVAKKEKKVEIKTVKKKEVKPKSKAVEVAAKPKKKPAAENKAKQTETVQATAETPKEQKPKYIYTGSSNN